MNSKSLVPMPIFSFDPLYVRCLDGWYRSRLGTVVKESCIKYEESPAPTYDEVLDGG